MWPPNLARVTQEPLLRVRSLLCGDLAASRDRLLITQSVVFRSVSSSYILNEENFRSLRGSCSTEATEIQSLGDGGSRVV